MNRSAVNENLLPTGGRFFFFTTFLGILFIFGFCAIFHIFCTCTNLQTAQYFLIVLNYYINYINI